jgi:hypothetical protein
MRSQRDLQGLDMLLMIHNKRHVNALVKTCEHL